MKFRGRITNAGSILGILMLCVTMGSTLEIEATGDDEQEALAAVESILKAETPTDSSSS